MDERHKRSNRSSTIILSGRIGGRDEDRNRWREGGLAGVGRGTLPDHCKEGGVGQVSHQLQP